MKYAWMLGILTALAGQLQPATGLAASQRFPEDSYWFYVAAESDDQVALVRFGPNGLEVEKTIDVGRHPTEIEGPHGLRVSPDGEHWYVSLAHGTPFGSVDKYRTGTDDLVGSVVVGMFPATIDVAASTNLLYVVNFDLHGDMEPSSISVVETGALVEVARVEVGVMPHSSRLNRDGDRQYSVMMMTDELVEVDALGFEVLRRLSLSDTGATGVARPTWVEPGAEGRFVYVAASGIDEIMEVDLETWEVSRRFETGKGPYNIDVTADGRLLIVTHRASGSTGIWGVVEGREVARIQNSKSLTHGVVSSPDSRYAFVSVEGISGEPGAVDVIDLVDQALVASVEVGKQASGISFWKMD